MGGVAAVVVLVWAKISGLMEGEMKRLRVFSLLRKTRRMRKMEMRKRMEVKVKILWCFF